MRYRSSGHRLRRDDRLRRPRRRRDGRGAAAGESRRVASRDGDRPRAHDLFNTFEHPDLFDRIVAENGAVLYDPATKSVESISPPPPPAFVESAGASVDAALGGPLHCRDR